MEREERNGIKRAEERQVMTVVAATSSCSGPSSGIVGWLRDLLECFLERERWRRSAGGRGLGEGREERGWVRREERGWVRGGIRVGTCDV